MYHILRVINRYDRLLRRKNFADLLVEEGREIWSLVVTSNEWRETQIHK